MQYLSLLEWLFGLPKKHNIDYWFLGVVLALVGLGIWLVWWYPPHIFHR
jgi:hypothetical protein